MMTQHEHFSTNNAHAEPGYHTNIWPEMLDPNTTRNIEEVTRQPVNINPVPTGLNHSISENSPEMKNIFSIAEMNLQRIASERDGNGRNHTHRTSQRWFT